MHDYELFLPPDDAVWQAFPFDPSVADRAAVEAERDRERELRADQVGRVVRELERLGHVEAARAVRLVDVEPGW